MVEYHRYLAIEITIEKVDHNPRRHTVGQRGKPAHIGQPDRRMDFLDIAAPDMSGEDPLTGVMPDIGIEQSARRATQGADFGDPRQRCHNRFDTGDLRVCETVGLVGRPRCHMNDAVGEDERRSQIVGHSLGAEFREDRKIENGVRDCQPTTNGQ